MKIAILGQPDGWYVRELLNQAISRGHLAEAVDFRTLCTRTFQQTFRISGETIPSSSQQLTELSTLDAVIVRTMPAGSLEQVVYRMDTLGQLHERGVQVLNSPRAIEVAVDKFLTTARLAGAGIPTPRTIVCENADQAMQAFQELGSDVVVKPLFGSEGRGILRISDPELAMRAFRTLERLQAVLYLQEYIAHAGFDVRVLTLNGQALGAFRRENPDDFRTNISRQGSASHHVLTDEERFLAIKAAEVVGSCFAGVDLMYDPSGRCVVIEVNAVPGWKAFQQVTGIDVALQVIQYLEEHHVAQR